MHKNTKWLIAWADRMNDKFGPPETGMEWCRNLAYAMGEAGNENPSPEAISMATKWELARFGNVYCSQCGRDFGPGEHGFSHCTNHNGLVVFDW